MIRGEARTLALVVVGLCGCLRTQPEAVEAAKLTLGPAALDFGEVFVGASPKRMLTVHNSGAEPGQATLSVSGPFSLDSLSFAVPAGADVVLDVTYAPAKVGHDTGAVSLGAQQVALTGDGKAALDCPTVACHQAVFDPNAGSCRDALLADGVSCAADGCYSQTMHVCSAGSCVAQPRAGNRCVNDWVAVTMPVRGGQAMAYDSDRKRVVVFGGVGLDDTWEWDGSRWLEVRPAASPPPHAAAAMIYDSNRKRMVLFAGDVSPSETWEYDGATWTQRFPVHSPSARTAAAFAYDPDRGVAVLFGGAGPYLMPGLLDDTWEWNGTDWTAVAADAPPSARASPGMVYDPMAKTMVLYGGSVDWPNGLTDVWHYDGTSWAQVSTTNSPASDPNPLMVYDVARATLIDFTSSDGNVWALAGAQWSVLATDDQPELKAIFGPTMAFDAARQRLVAYAGTESYASENRTWEWDGAHWEQVDPPTPAPRADPGFVYDSHRGVVVMFGGGAAEEVATVVPADTWEWNGDGWTPITTLHLPPPRRQPAMAYDRERGLVVMFGGLAADGSTLNDTWEYDGNDWNQRSSNHAPPARSLASAAYDPDLHQFVVFGGVTGCGDVTAYCGATPFDDFWGWTGNDWAPIQTSTMPPGLYRAAMTYDEARHQVLLYGGTHSSSDGTADTWVFDGQDWSRVQASGPAPLAGAMLSYDPVHQRALLLGGDSATIPSQRGFYAWDGASWTAIASLRPGPAVAGAGMAFDSARGELLVFGGQRDVTDITNDTWIFVPAP